LEDHFSCPSKKLFVYSPLNFKKIIAKHPPCMNPMATSEDISWLQIFKTFATRETGICFEYTISKIIKNSSMKVVDVPTYHWGRRVKWRGIWVPFLIKK
jgi:hypothetical protein